MRNQWRRHPEEQCLLWRMALQRVVAAAAVAAVAATVVVSLCSFSTRVECLELDGIMLHFHNNNMDRRLALTKGAMSFVVSSLTTTSTAAAATAAATTTTTSTTTAATTTTTVPSSSSSFPQVYQVFPDASESLNPKLEEVVVSFPEWIEQLSRTSGAIWLGEHHNSMKDHTLQTEFIQQIQDATTTTRRTTTTTTGREEEEGGGGSVKKPITIGLEQVQIQFQSVLDEYIEGSISFDEMIERVEWETRWSWPYEQYRPIFELAQSYRIPLLALNVNSEDLLLIERDGLPNVPKQQISQYITDPRGFADYTQPVSYRTYMNYVIRPSYDMHESMGLLQYSMLGEPLSQPISFRDFFFSRILWDECMANRAYQWTQTHPNGIFIGLVGADHVKFQKGIPGRFSRLVAKKQPPSNSSSSSSTTTRTTPATCTSILLNPTYIDTRPSGSVNMMENQMKSTPDQIILQLRYVKDGVDSNTMEVDERTLSSNTGGVLPLADYLLLN